MISNPLIYLLTLAFSATLLYMLESKTNFKIFKFVPSVVMIYALSMFMASMGVFEYNDEINEIYKRTKTNLLPAMLFLMLIQVNLKDFFKLGKPLIISYLLAVFSLGFAFIFIVGAFAFNQSEASAFGALAGSWMGGTANMIAVGSALEVSQNAFGYALIVDSVNYTIWVMFLLFIVPFASVFNHFTKANENKAYLGVAGCACTMGASRYWLLIFFALGVSLFSQTLAYKIDFISQTTSVVIIASGLGILGSFTALRNVGGSSEVATTMLYVIIALIGSKAVFDSFEGLGTYVLAGFLILLFHGFIMVLGAKIFKLDLFSISVASLANIGGVASAPILAATYNKALVSVGVLMAIKGYIIGTFGGLLVGKILILFAS